MPEYGWAYVNLDALNSVNGATGSITFRTSETDISGTSAFVYATASHKVGLGINTPGDAVVGTLPAYILDISASAGDTTAVRIAGDLQISGSALISGSIKAESLDVDTIISSSHLIIRDPVIGMGFGDETGETGSVGDRGLILGLAGNLNQAIIWDQTSGSFVMGKVGAQGPDQDAFDIPDGDLSTLRVSDLTASNSVSASVFYGNGEHLTGIAGGGAVTSYTNAADNRIITSVDANTINGEQKLTFDGSRLVVDGAISGSGTFEAVGDATFGGKLNVSSSAVFASSISGSSTLEIVGTINSTGNIASSGSISGSTGEFGNVTINGVTANTVSGSGVLEIVGVTTLGDNLLVSGTIKAPNIGAGTDNSVVVLDASGFLKTDEADPRIFGTSLVDGTGGAGQITLWSDSDTVQGSTSLVYDGSTVVNDNNYSGSGTFENVGSAVFGNTLEVSGTVSVTSKIEHALDTDTHLKFDTDKIEFIAGNETLLTLTEDTQDIVIVGDGGDVDFQVKTSAHNHTIFAQGSDALVGIRSSAPTAVLHLSESGASQIGMPKPMFRIDHPGDAAGKEFTEALLFVTGAIPDDYFEARVGINTKTPEGAFHVKTQEGQNTFLVVDDKVVVGNNNAAAKFQVRKSQGGSGDRDVMRIESILNSDDTVHNLFYVTGSTDGTGFFGSYNTGSNLAVSGTAFFTAATASVGFSGSVGNFATLNINSVAIDGGTVDGTTIGGTTPDVVNQTAGTVKYRLKAAGDSPYSVTDSDYIIGVNTTGGAVEIDLQAASSAGTGRMLIIKDVGGAAGTNNITIDPNGSETIDGEATVVIAANSGSVMLFCDGSNYFIAGTR